MSAFCVFGMTQELAKSLAAKKHPPERGMTEEEYAAFLAQKAEHILTHAARRQVSPPL